MNMLTNLYIKVQTALRSQKGQGMVEYGLILVFVSIVVIGVLTTMGTDLEKVFTDVSAKLKLRPAS